MTNVPTQRVIDALRAQRNGALDAAAEQLARANELERLLAEALTKIGELEAAEPQG